jgi:Zn finger protein HypA/HybF involved in hydrogenase expression
MEERELVGHVLQIIDETAYRIAARRIRRVHLAVGGCPRFRLRSSTQRFHRCRPTVAEGAQLFVKALPVPHHCQNRGNNFEATKSDCPCLQCEHPHTEVGGEELRVLSLV